MKIMTILGTRPEIIRLSAVIPKLDKFAQHIVVHTGQNYDANLKDIFFEELELRQPDISCEVVGEHATDRIGDILIKTGDIMRAERPDRVLILGDTDSGMSAITAARMGIPVYHMEAGNRSYDKRIPEEVNRRIIDHCSTIHMPYTSRSAENLIREGIRREDIHIIGNPINEVMNTYCDKIWSSDALDRLRLKREEYFLVTVHRAGNVDDPMRLRQIFQALDQVAGEYKQPVIVSVHPRTAKRIDEYGIYASQYDVRRLPAMGFMDFSRLERDARCVLSDSGLVQEECCINMVPNVTLRDVTERGETIECGASVMVGCDPEMILDGVRLAVCSERAWLPPAEYVEEHVSSIVANIICGV